MFEKGQIEIFRATGNVKKDKRQGKIKRNNDKLFGFMA